MGNVTKGVNRRRANWSTSKDFAAFDKLPRAARIAVTQCALLYDVTTLKSSMRKRGIKAHGAMVYIAGLDSAKLHGTGPTATKNVYGPSHPQA